MIVKFNSIREHLRNRVQQFRYVKQTVLAALLSFVIIMGGNVPTYAQTPVPLVINTNDIMTQTNTWIATFSPIQAIGIGMALALAILGFIGAMMISAFSKNKR